MRRVSLRAVVRVKRARKDDTGGLLKTPHMLLPRVLPTGHHNADVEFNTIVVGPSRLHNDQDSRVPAYLLFFALRGFFLR